jgi:hypothetical protein
MDIGPITGAWPREKVREAVKQLTTADGRLIAWHEALVGYDLRVFHWTQGVGYPLLLNIGGKDFVARHILDSAHPILIEDTPLCSITDQVRTAGAWRGRVWHHPADILYATVGPPNLRP